MEAPPPARVASDVVEIEVEPENWDAVRLFNAMGTQWHFTSIGTAHACAVIRTGLNYAALGTFAAGLAITVNEELLGALGVLEGETVRLCNSDAERALRRG